MNLAPDIPNSILSVGELNRLARQVLETRLPLLSVAGEISNLAPAASGHVYFTLKDSAAQVRCVMFRSRAQLLGWRPENGQHVEARVLVTLYEARGDFQLNVEGLRLAGSGELYARFIRLKRRLDEEGLFAAGNKRVLPGFPRCIGIVSSPQAAALRDVVTTLCRRSPQVAVVLYPTLVQGPGAAAEIVAALATASRRRDCDLLILCRGGGSIEDLWSFNEEIVARAIRDANLPVIAGIGHETDFTIADFAADLRAPTPTAAAELAAPARNELLDRLDRLRARLERTIAHRLDAEQQRLDYLAGRLRHPAETLRRHRSELGHLAARCDNLRRHLTAPYRSALDRLGERLRRQRPDLPARQAALQRQQQTLRQEAAAGLRRRSQQLATLAAQLRHLDPNAVLGRGYSIVSTPDGRIIRDANSVEPGVQIVVHPARGRLIARVETSDADPSPPGAARH